MPQTDKHMKARIEKLIDIYCTHVFGVDRDAGWHAPSQLEGLKDACNSKRASFQQKQLSVRVAPGEERQANDRADDKMIGEIRYIRNKHHDFELAKMLFFRLTDKQLVALIAERYLKYVYKRAFTEQEVAEYLEVSKSSYRHSRKTAVIQVERKLEFIEEYEEVKAA